MQRLLPLLAATILPSLLSLILLHLLNFSIRSVLQLPSNLALGASPWLLANGGGCCCCDGLLGACICTQAKDGEPNIQG